MDRRIWRKLQFKMDTQNDVKYSKLGNRFCGFNLRFIRSIHTNSDLKVTLIFSLVILRNRALVWRK